MARKQKLALVSSQSNVGRKPGVLLAQGQGLGDVTSTKRAPRMTSQTYGSGGQPSMARAGGARGPAGFTISGGEVNQSLRVTNQTYVSGGQPSRVQARGPGGPAWFTVSGSEVNLSPRVTPQAGDHSGQTGTGGARHQNLVTGLIRAPGLRTI